MRKVPVPCPEPSVTGGSTKLPCTCNLSSDQINREMVSAMIKLARTLEFRVIAEQVEQQEDFDWLREVGVDFVQGNFVEPPVTLGSGQGTGSFRILTNGDVH